MSTVDTQTTDPHSLNARWVLTIFLRTWPFIRPLVKHLFAFVGLSAIVGLVAAIITLILINIATAGVLAGDPIGGMGAAIFSLDPAVYVEAESLDEATRKTLLWPSLALAILLALIGVPSAMGLYYYSMWIFQQINQLMRIRLVDRLQAQSLSFHAQSETGDAIYRVYQDSAMVTQIIRSIFLDPLMMIGRYLFGLFFVLAFDPLLALVLGLVTIPVMVIGYYFSPRLRIRFRGARETNSSLTSWIQESVQGIRVIKATGSEANRRAGFREHSEEALAAAFRARVSLALMGILVFSSIGLAILAVEALAAIWSNQEAETFGQWILVGLGFAVWNFGTFSAVQNRSNNGLGALRGFMAIWGRAQDMAMGLGRVFEILDMEPDIQNAPDAIDLPPVERGVEFHNVSFGYLPDRPVLSGVDFEAANGTVTAIVGPTGTGKSTLMSLLLRLADPKDGQITIDGQDIRGVTVDSLRASIAIATQENILFSTTVTDNIRFAVPDATDEAVQAAATVACAHDFIEALPDAYRTPLGERATKLSSGQRQRIVIARAVIKDAPILILDEPTAALDAETELAVLESLKSWGKERCIFLITHRLSTIRQADNVIYLRDGGILAQGAHDDLMASSDVYQQFVAAETGVTS
ncbi:MAG: ABC transporter ATP-binding protein [Pseudomonadota bacterium]